MKNLFVIALLLVAGCKVSFMESPRTTNVAEMNYEIQACQQYCDDNGATMNKLEGTTCMCNNQKGPVFVVKPDGE
jgi:hypothetical protein